MNRTPSIKVLYIIDSLHGYGAERSIVEITRNFSKITPVFVSVYQDGILSSILKQNEIKHYSLQINMKFGYAHALEKIAKIYILEKPNIVHATLYKSEIISRKLKSQFPEMVLIGSLISNVYASGRYTGRSLFKNLKLVYHHILDRRSAQMVDYFVSNSQAIKYVSQKALNIPESKITVIHRGRDPKQFIVQKGIGKFESNKTNEIKLVNIGRLIATKGQLDIINIMPAILEKYPSIILKLAGEGPMKGVLNENILSLGLKEKVSLLGEVDEITQLLFEASLFIFPSYSEGLSGALIEAMMSGCTIIVSDIPENLECVGEDGAYIYPSGNLRELQKKIIYAIEHPEESHCKAQAAKKRAMQMFDVMKISEQYEDFYTKITS